MWKLQLSLLQRWMVALQKVSYDSIDSWSKFFEIFCFDISAFDMHMAYWKNSGPSSQYTAHRS